MAQNESILKSVSNIRRQLDEAEQVTVTIALFGQPGSGKSSLVNKLVGQPLASVGVATDQTRQAQTYHYNGVHLVDLPGFDTVRFPKESFWERFKMDSFDLFLCVFSEKLGSAEVEFFSHLQKHGRTCLFVRNKRDDIWDTAKSVEDLEKEIREDVSRLVRAQVKVYFTSCRDDYGLDALSEAIAGHLPQAKQERWIESAKAYSRRFLEAKLALCKKKVRLNAGLSAANAINPLPGMDVAVDISILLSLFRSIKKAYGLNDKALLTSREFQVPALAQLANNLIKNATRAGVIRLLQRVATREITKSTSKYIPLVGQAIAASIGYGITLQAGNAYLADCHELASAVMERELLRRHC
ncbi:MAG: 50S ribosome-binding GTPase [Desulfatibacillaceae bacterium]|nr:50S ribosome-binding GTPase [Desulfatibacillaceae bacterium]